MMVLSNEICKGDIYLIQFDPTIGDEIAKTRPAVILDNNYSNLELRIVVPITSWQDKFETWDWMLKLNANTLNGLAKDSAINCYQIKSISLERFVKKIGVVNPHTLKMINLIITSILH
ncbi:type II toxin-antitoxin system PemK/MazF family toxin [Campylobacter helveticus]|uniref:type II toxin-antitoxin system PemK/MazF family toxin n=2 Tax=Campylobacter helveticus TaxID=28898 RepID=UPI00197A9B66|nr:type II toxin-antitoxin system PemK/MazF family toxin [Campylobacter helveticus]MCR2067279.1 type II toxin-antitoxin system PemK/MazF family toxin [Campylobacter helveticus]